MFLKQSSECLNYTIEIVYACLRWMFHLSDFFLGIGLGLKIIQAYEINIEECLPDCRYYIIDRASTACPGIFDDKLNRYLNPYGLSTLI